MQIQRIQNNNYNTNFSAKLEVKPIKGMITNEEIMKLQEKAKNIGNPDSLIYIILHKPYTRDLGPFSTAYHGVKVDAITYHNCKFDSAELKKEVNFNEGHVIDVYSRVLKEPFRPFNIISDWLDSVFKPKELVREDKTLKDSERGWVQSWDLILN